MNLYRIPITELKKNYSDTIINLAFRSWQRKNLDTDTIVNKSDRLVERLDRANKREFIAIIKRYEEMERRG